MSFEKKPNTGKLWARGPQKSPTFKGPTWKGDHHIVCPHCSVMTDYEISGWNNTTRQGKPYISTKVAVVDDAMLRKREEQSARAKAKAEAKRTGVAPQQAAPADDPLSRMKAAQEQGDPFEDDNIPF